jgi:hypothetical protein
MRHQVLFDAGRPRQAYPLLVHVYGEPAGTTVTDAFGGCATPPRPARLSRRATV